MKCLSKLTLLAFVLLAALASAQNGPFQHIIIIVQENRTPDNLFGAGAPNHVGPCGGQDDFELGVDIENGGPVKSQAQEQCFMPLPLSAWDAALNEYVDPDHSYNYNGWGWVYDFDGGAMDGFCHWYGATCPQYSYVQKSDVQPYFDIATAYGFANYMFQSSEGPSLEAHQFLFTGTSAPVAPNDSSGYGIDFVAELTTTKEPYPQGCPYTGAAGWPNWVQPDGSEEGDPRKSPNQCYTHDSLVTDANDCTNPGVGTDYCDRSIPGTTHKNDWAYYVEPSAAPGGMSGWDAPADIPEVCYGQNATWNNNDCDGGPGGAEGYSTEWYDHIRVPQGPVPYNVPQIYSSAPIFDDLYDCNYDMPAISWVIPDSRWSDHPQGGSVPLTVYGPSWVGDIVDAVGQACGGIYWSTEPTAIFVVWDDWGGWYDHIAPWIARQQNPHSGYTACDPSTQWGCGYTDGFRVPLLAVSPYTPAGYVSGACQGANCPNFGKSTSYIFGEYTHDVGSILAYTEWNFGFNPQFIASPDYADWNAPDWSTDHVSHVPLSDFFNTNNQYTFTSISTPFPAGFFQNYYQTQLPGGGYPVPTGPDGDDSD